MAIAIVVASARAGLARRGAARWGAGALVLLLLLAVPLLITNQYHLAIIKQLGITVILTLGFNLIFGYTGQLSLAHATFYGIGAYGPAILITKLGWPIWLAVPVTLALCAAIAVVVGIPTLRLAGYYLAVATLALATLAEVVVWQWQDLTSGAYGIQNIDPVVIFGTPLKGANYYYVILGSVLLVLLLQRNLMASRIGRAFLAIRESESAAAAVGIGVAYYKVLAFAISAVLAATAGVVYTFDYLYVNPFMFGLENTFLWLFMVLVGGLGSAAGTVVGTILLGLIPEVFAFVGEYYILVYGLVMILVVLFFPTGLIGIAARLGALRPGRQGASTLAPGGELAPATERG